MEGGRGVRGEVGSSAGHAEGRCKRQVQSSAGEQRRERFLHHFLLIFARARIGTRLLTFHFVYHLFVCAPATKIRDEELVYTPIVAGGCRRVVRRHVDVRHVPQRRIGRERFVLEHVKVGAAETVWLYAAPAVPPGSDDGDKVIVGHDTTML